MNSSHYSMRVWPRAAVFNKNCVVLLFFYFFFCPFYINTERRSIHLFTLVLSDVLPTLILIEWIFGLVHLVSLVCFHSSCLRLGRRPVQLTCWNCKSSGIGPKFCRAPPVADTGRVKKKTTTKKPIRKGRQMHVTGHQASTVSGYIYGDNVPKQFISRKAVSELCFLLLEAHHRRHFITFLLLVWPPWRAFCPASRDQVFFQWLICFNPKPHWAEWLLL